MLKKIADILPRTTASYYFHRLCMHDKSYFGYFQKRVSLDQRISSSILRSSNNIHTSCSAFVKHFVENENKYAYSALRKIEVYRKTLSNPNFPEESIISDEEFNYLCSANWSEELAVNIYHVFKKLSSYSSKNPQTISDVKFNGIVKALASKCPDLNDEDLIGILACLRKWSPTSSATSENFVDLWKAVDEQCIARVKNWDRNKLLFVADHWYLLNLTSFSNLMWRCLTRLTRKPENITPQQLVQCMFYINARRKIPDVVSLYDIEYSLEKCYDQLSIDEISIFAMGFFKSETSIKSQNLVLGIMREVMDKAEVISDIALTALLKVIRYSLAPTNVDPLLALLDKLSSQIDRLSLLSCVHVALTGTTILVLHEEVLNKVVDRVYKEIDSCRLKDLERIAFALSLYNYKHEKTPNIYDLLVEQLSKSERLDEIKAHPKCVSCCLNYLSQNGIYLQQEISKVLDKQFLLTVYGE